MGLERLLHCLDCGQPLPRMSPIRCTACGEMQWNDAKPCACAFVVSDSKLLFVQRARDPWKGFWEVPGGFCEPAEHPVDTAVREVFEETGLEIRVTGFLGIWLDDYNEPGRHPKRTMNIYYHAIPAGTNTLSPPSAEVSAVAFFADGEMPASVAFPGHLPSAIRAWRRAADTRMLTTPLFDIGAAL